MTKKETIRKKVKISNVISFERDADFYFERGMKYIERRQYENSLKFIRMAAEKEPYNVDFQFNLAGVLAELKKIEESNQVLMGILKNLDPTMTECYFGMACNCFELGNYSKAREFFEKYIYLDPNGEFVEEAQDVLYYLQIQDHAQISRRTLRKITRMAEEGKSLLDSGNFKKAITVLEKVVEADLEVISPRNNLSLAYFYSGEYEKAIKLALSVLKLDPGNIHAECNLALFYMFSGKSDISFQQLKMLRALVPENKEQVLKLVDTFVKLNEDKQVSKILKNWLKNNKEQIFLQFFAISLLRQGKFKEAKKAWGEMKESFPQCRILADYYNDVCIKVEDGNLGADKITYSNKMDDSVIKDYQLVLEDYMAMDCNKFINEWKGNPLVKDIISYFLLEGPLYLRNYLLDKLVAMNEETAGILLEDILGRVQNNDFFKAIITKALKSRKDEKINEPGPGNKDGKLKLNSSWNKDWDEVIDCALDKREKIYGRGYKKELRDIWLKSIVILSPDHKPIIRKKEVWAAVLEYLFCLHNKIQVTQKQLADKYEISPATIGNRLRWLEDNIRENEKED